MNLVINSNPTHFLQNLFDDHGYRFVDFSELKGKVLWSAFFGCGSISFETAETVYHLECDNRRISPLTTGSYLRDMISKPIIRAEMVGDRFILATESNSITIHFDLGSSDNLVFWSCPSKNF